MSKKILIASVSFFIFVAVLAGVVFVVQKKKQEQLRNKETQNENLQEQNNSLVWFQIPELNIKFQVEKDIADVIGYREQLAERGKTGGYELYSKNYPETMSDIYSSKPDSFAFIMEYTNYKEDSHLDQIMLSCNKLLFQTDKRLVCYFNDSISQGVNKNRGTYDKFDSATKKLFDGYLKDVPCEEISK